MDVFTEALTARIRMRLVLVLALVLAGALVLPAAAQMFYDPLTPNEADQVRQTADKLDKRLPLLLSFARGRLDHFQSLRTASSSPPDRESQLYDLLRQYHAIVAELDDAADDLTAAHAQYKDAAKVLQQAIAGEQALQAELQSIRSGSSPADLASYHFELDDCLDITSDSLQNAHEDWVQASAKKK